MSTASGNSEWNELAAKLVVVLPPEGMWDGDSSVPGWDAPAAERPWTPFAPEVTALCEAFAQRLLGDRRCAGFPDLTALGFWFRRSRMAKLREMSPERADGVRLGRGIVFHLAPGNVDTMFVYTLFMGLLAGNVNVVRLGGRTTAQQTLLLELLGETLREFPQVARRLLVVRYGHDDAVTAFFSRRCDVRVIWGGDETVERIRRIPIPARAVELTFPNRFSLAVFDAAALLGEESPRRLVSGFVTDAFSFGQQGCSSPRLICWRGTAAEVSAAQAKFWPLVEQELRSRPFAISAAEAMERWLNVNSVAIESAIGPADTPRDAAGLVWTASEDGRSFIRLALRDWSDLRRSLNTGGGLFFELRIADLAEVLRHAVRRDQTVASYGVSGEEWRESLRCDPPEGVFRIVRVGSALEFSPVWDGFDLIAAMSRIVQVDV